MAEMTDKLAQMIEVRDHTLALFAEISKPADVPSQIRDALGYSERTITHMIGFNNALAAARLDATSGDYHDISYVNPDVDIVFKQEGKNPVYYFAANVFQEHQALFGEDTHLNIAIVQDNESVSRWISSYHSLVFYDSISPDSYGSSNLYPDHTLLLNFWFVPEALDGQQILDKLPMAKVVRDNIRFVGSTIRNGLTHFDFVYDALAQAEVEAETPYVDDLAEKFSTFLRERGNFTFSIVEAGLVSIDGKKHMIYTGSEKIF